MPAIALSQVLYQPCIEGGRLGGAALKKSEVQVWKAADHTAEKQRLADGLLSFGKAAGSVVLMAAGRRTRAEADGRLGHKQ